MKRNEQSTIDTIYAMLKQKDYDDFDKEARRRGYVSLHDAEIKKYEAVIKSLETIIECYRDLVGIK